MMHEVWQILAFFVLSMVDTTEEVAGEQGGKR
jgi:hypothetical protein